MLTYSSPCFIPKNWRKWRCKWAVRTKIMKVGIAGWWWGGGNHVPNATHVLSRDENKGTHTRYNRKPGIIQYSGLTWDMCSKKVSQSVTNYKLLITMPCDWDTLVKKKVVTVVDFDSACMQPPLRKCKSWMNHRMLSNWIWAREVQFLELQSARETDNEK